MPACPYCSSSDLTRDGHDQRGRAVRACRACGRHATSESASLLAGHRFPRDIILLAVRYYLQLGAAAERIAGILADRGIDVSGRTILRWVQKFGPALSDEIRRYRKSVSTTWLGRREVREDPGQVALPVPRCRSGWTGARWLAVADPRPGGGRGLLPPYDPLDRMPTRACGHRQGRVLPIGHPHVRTRREAYRHRVLQPGDLDQPLPAEAWLREVSHPSHARTEELRVRHTAVPRLGCAAAGSTSFLVC